MFKAWVCIIMMISMDGRAGDHLATVADIARQADCIRIGEAAKNRHKSSEMRSGYVTFQCVEIVHTPE